MKKMILDLPDADVTYFPELYTPEKATALFNRLLKETHWQQDEITLFGKTHPQPRLTALYAENGKPYSYSNITMYPKPFSPLLKELKTEVEKRSNCTFTTVLLNLYRHGKDANGWHSDDEKELGENPVIASLSFGAERMFHLKHKYNPELKTKIALQHGSLLLMQGTTQHFWKHQLAKTKKEVSKRINLTFRSIC